MMMILITMANTGLLKLNSARFIIGKLRDID